MTQALHPNHQMSTDGAADRERLDREARFFQEHYADLARTVEPLSAFDRQRYSNPPANTIFPREYYFHLLNPLAGKDVLEIASGNGIDACIAAHNGANVHAYDISANATAMVRRRAELTGVGQRVTTEVTGVFGEAYAGRKFDAIMGYAALHHIPLEGMAEQIYDRLKPGGAAVFAEPVINSQWLYALRKCVPYTIDDPTEDEVPLNDADIAALAQPFDRVQKRYFQVTSRVWRMWASNWALAKGLHQLDALLMRLPGVEKLATVAVFSLHRDR